MTWLIFSLLNAFFESISHALGKRGTEKFDIYSVAWSQRFFSLLLLFPAVLFTHSFQEVNTAFWIAVALNSILNTFIFLLFYKAIKDSPLSLTLPIVTLTPVFLLITSPLIVGEFPSALGVLGIITTVAGSYVLNLSKRAHSPFEPFVSIVREKGTRLMLIVAFLWSITSNIDKIGVLNSNPVMYLFVHTCFVVLFLSIILVIKRISLKNVFKQSALLAPIGIATGLSGICQMTAISMTLVPNVIAVKRTSALFGVVWGKVFFKEDNIGERLLGSAIMVLGVVLIVLG